MMLAALRRAAGSLRTRVARLGRGLTVSVSDKPALPENHSTYRKRLHREIERYKADENVHDLPEIFHFWSNKYIRPKIEEVIGVLGFEEFYVKYISRYASDHPGEPIEIASLGAGNADMEVGIAQALRNRGLMNFRIRCLDINPSMLGRGRELALQSQLADRFEFLEVDLARWRAECPLAVVIAHHSLHHIVALEEVFQNIQEAIGNSGYFLTCDMIGRNVHMRWPEALTVIHEIWRTMPDRYKYNHQLRRFEKMLDNWDCSTEGFEGIRSQDILPLLVKNFHFEAFVAYGNLPDIFVDRGFGHNFDVANAEDTDFIDRIGVLNDRQISDGLIKPTQMVAVMRACPTVDGRCYKHWTPQFCIRPVSAMAS